MVKVFKLCAVSKAIPAIAAYFIILLALSLLPSAAQTNRPEVRVRVPVGFPAPWCNGSTREMPVEIGAFAETRRDAGMDFSRGKLTSESPKGHAQTFGESVQLAALAPLSNLKFAEGCRFCQGAVIGSGDIPPKGLGSLRSKPLMRTGEAAMDMRDGAPPPNLTGHPAILGCLWRSHSDAVALVNKQPEDTRAIRPAPHTYLIASGFSGCR